MPNFEEFGYYFALDILGVSKFAIGVGLGASGLIMLGYPLFFQKFLVDVPYKGMFVFN